MYKDLPYLQYKPNIFHGCLNVIYHLIMTITVNRTRTRTTWSVFFLKHVNIFSVQLLHRTTLLLFMPCGQKWGQTRLTKKSFQTLSKPKYMGKALKELKLRVHSRRNLQQLIFGEYYLPFGSESFFFLLRLLPQGAQNRRRWRWRLCHKEIGS